MQLKPSAPTRAVIYTRVSRDDTGEGRSTQRQEEACRQLAAAREYRVVEVCEDISISAWSGKQRPGWLRVLELVERGEVDVIVAWHMDRLTRRMLDLEQLILLAEHNRVGVVTVTGDIDLTNDTGRMVGRILAAVARAEVERKGARQKLANRQRAREGKPHLASGRAFGYEPDGVTVRRVEADALVKACADFRAGVPVGTIAREWTTAGFVSRNAKPDKDGTPTIVGWSSSGVRRVLRNPRYAGLRLYLGEVVAEAIWEPIIDLETHLAVTAKFAERARSRHRKWSGRTAENLLSGIAICDACGAGLWANKLRGMLTYTCPNGHTWVERYDADAVVRSAVVMAGRRATAAGPIDIAGHRAEQFLSLDLHSQRHILKDSATICVRRRNRQEELTAKDLISILVDLPARSQGTADPDE